ncbi:HAD family phosphatase [Bifidobacterium sp. CP2]|uniref:HAD family hydrolase n=1 Tax=Bifidobacterium sp. CP2 TaxID=2809025 RepID=UPI001BDD0B23|nr:HAD family phosphatase [Bifidobacterium sp. CP2]MBT1181123.1 HAD family phosphatase [Bifidobacterium sp. CP2]
MWWHDEKPEAVFWDLDGTLIDSDPYWVRAERALLEEHGGVWDDPLAEAMQGASLPTVTRLLHERGVSGMDHDAIVARLTADVMRMEDECLPWIPGVRDALTGLAEAGVPSVLVTGSPRPIVDNVIAHAPAGAFVGSVSGEEDMPHKPAPEPYWAAARIAGIVSGVDGAVPSIAPVDSALMRRCVVFEDSVPGLTAARAAGATVVAVTGYARVDVTADPALRSLYDRTIRDFRDLR